MVPALVDTAQAPSGLRSGHREGGRGYSTLQAPSGLQGTGTKSRPRYALRAPIGTAYAGSSIASVST